jgi:hypothetical protein
MLMPLPDATRLPEANHLFGNNLRNQLLSWMFWKQRTRSGKRR